MASTARLSKTSGQRRKASQSERRTKPIIGASSFHMLLLTREKIALPRSSQPDNHTLWRGNADSSEASRARAVASPLFSGSISPSASRFVGEREVTLSKIHRHI